MPIDVEFISELEAPLDLVWDRVVRVSGASDELWPFAKMTRPAFEDRLTTPEPGVLPPFRGSGMVTADVVRPTPQRHHAWVEGSFHFCGVAIR